MSLPEWAQALLDAFFASAGTPPGGRALDVPLRIPVRQSASVVVSIGVVPYVRFDRPPVIDPPGGATGVIKLRCHRQILDANMQLGWSRALCHVCAERICAERFGLGKLPTWPDDAVRAADVQVPLSDVRLYRGSIHGWLRVHIWLGSCQYCRAILWA